ncbi:exo-beta-N-acetylmuramidase NamZ family protein [Vagococcus fessus]|uniref:DUF1343 domain-containing protein n=1 Tax=Vagococcus fessus TaxID=120370 RepID=A0A430A5A0_9ENTE|nr:DUF1343 domain-containing protein [Vagococcus fessus]RSU01988.1 hypothetical protein CBF31_09500 [Vagococcus fessus]
MAVLNGIDRLDYYEELFKGKRLGVIASSASVDSDFNSTVDLLAERFDVRALYGPEHGIRGDQGAGEMVEDYIDMKTGIPVYSLYRKDSKRFTPELLEGVDAVVYDIQDVGVRYYTFISTMIYALEDCQKYGKELIILDRINPLGGAIVEGNLLDEEFKSFVGAYSLPNRYGLTIGELAKMVNEEQQINCNLSIVPCKNWDRNSIFNETSRLWMMPSLGLPTFETAFSYVGTCLFEGTNISEGRGTTCPFIMIGAPFIKASELVTNLKVLKLKGIYFTEAYFTPTFSKHQGKYCEGVHLHFSDYHQVSPLKIGLILLDMIKKMYPNEFEFVPPYSPTGKPFIDYLSGSSLFTDQENTYEMIIEKNHQDSLTFKKRKEAFHLY